MRPKNRADHLRIKHLRLLELMAEHRSLIGVATAMHLSQSTVTGMVQSLEAVFGTTLIDRNPRGGGLTESGMLAMRQLRVALASFESALESASESTALPVVRVGVLPLMDAWLFPQAMARLEATRAMPRLKVLHAGITALFSALDAGDIDCAVCHVDELPLHLGHLTNLHIEPLNEESRLFACARDHPLARRSQLRLTDLLDQRWILPPRDSQARRVMNRVFLNAGLVPPQALIESFPFYANLQTVAVTRMLTFAPASPVRQFVRLGLVHALSVAEEMPVSRLAFLVRAPVLEMPGVDALRRAFAWAAQHQPQLSAAPGTPDPA